MSLQMYGWQTGTAKILSWISVTDWCVRGLFRHRQAARESEQVRTGSEGGCGAQMAVLLALFFSRLRKKLLCHDGNSRACSEWTRL